MFICNHSIPAQSSLAAEYQIKAVFLYNFTRFIEWPPRVFETPYSHFVIGLIGDEPFAPYIEAAIHGERLGTHTIKLERYRNINEIRNCHILFVASKDPEEIRNILKAVSGRNILTVGDSPNFARWGGMIRFYKEQEKIRLQINNIAAREAGLKISSKLLRLAHVL